MTDAGFSGRAPTARRLIRTGVFTAFSLAGVAIAAAWIFYFHARDESLLALGALLCVTLATTAAVILLRQIILDLAAREQEAARLAGHDLLSGIANRLLFTQWVEYELARHRREQTQFAILCLDIDRFKQVNDTHGHAAGDALIRAIAHRLSDIIRPTDRLARIGGDEFAILQTSVRSMRDAEALATRIIEAMCTTFNLNGLDIHSGTSIGIALCPENATERDDLMKMADLALYRAKKEGRNRFAFFDQRLGEELSRLHKLEAELSEAIAGDRLALDYLPAYDAQDLQIRMIEARLRWPHPARGLMEAKDFLDTLENRKLILPLGKWLLNRACRDAVDWQGMRIGLTVAAQHLRARDFASQVLHVLDETGLDPQSLELQIKEETLLAAPDACAEVMKTLRSEGVRFALVDYGTGLASLGWLRRFPISRIRLHRNCLDSLQGAGDSAAILHSTIHLARDLGMIIAADGLESEEQLHILAALGCQEAQGRFLSRHLSTEDVSRAVKTQARQVRRDYA